MDLSFSRFETEAQVVAIPPDLAVMMVGVAARQAASPTAMIQAGLPRDSHRARFRPAHGAFNIKVWEMLRKCDEPTNM